VTVAGTGCGAGGYFGVGVGGQLGDIATCLSVVPGQIVLQKLAKPMRRIFYVDRSMCGGETLPDDFDVEEFCEVLQGKLQDDIEVVAVEVGAQAQNLDGGLVSDAVFFEALGEYCHR